MNSWREILKITPIIVGIALLINLFTYQAVDLLYPRAEYNDFCTNSRSAKQINEPDICIADGGRWESFNLPPEQIIDEDTPAGYCDADYSCRESFETAEDQRTRILFIVLLVLGAFSMALGQLFRSTAVSLGFSWASAFLFLGALGNIWRLSGELGQLAVIVLALLVLIYVGGGKVKRYGRN